MPKFYITSGEVREIVVADNPLDAAAKAMLKLVCLGYTGYICNMVGTSQTGFFGEPNRQTHTDKIYELKEVMERAGKINDG